jgi:hypothetical protein
MLANATRKLSASLKCIKLSKVIHNGNLYNIKIKSNKLFEFEPATRRTPPRNAERQTLNSEV